MAIGDLVTDDFMFEFAGVAFGGCCDTGMDYISIAGLDLPNIRTGDLNRPRDHGMQAGVDFVGSRTIEVKIGVAGSSATDLEAKLRSLQTMNTTISATEQPLVFQLPTEGKRRVNARLRRRSFPVDVGYSAGKIVQVIMQFVAMDPRIYDNNLTTIAMALPAVSGGLSWPVHWPLGWGSATSGLYLFTNLGTFASRPVVTFTGPLTAPNIQNVTTGQTWISTFDLQNGDTLVVDFDAKTVLLNGTSSRYSFLTSASVWWDLGPGVTSIKIGAAAGSGSASISARSAWM